MLVIENGTILTAEGRYEADVLVRDGTIVGIAKDLAIPAGARAIDATGQYLIPGGIDPHVHISGGPRGDDYLGASRAALAGGITTISKFVRATDGRTLAEAVNREAERIREQALADVILHARIDAPESQAAQLAALAQIGDTSVKVYMSNEEFDRDARAYLAALKAAGNLGILTMIHCEDGSFLSYALAELTAEGKTSLEYFPDSRPTLAEVVATQRAVAMAELTGSPIYIVHLSSDAALQVASQARQRGLAVYVETRPLYLHFTRDRFRSEDRGLYVGWPPLRAQQDQDALWAGIAGGSVDVVATDHFARTKEEKLDPKQTISRHRPATNNLQMLRPMLYSEGVVGGRISPERFVAVTATNPAKLFGLYPKKGAITVGSDADIVLWDPDETRTVRDEDMLSSAGFSVYSGREVTGWPTMTIRRGEVVYEKGEIRAEPGSGRLLTRGRWQRP